MTAMAQGLVTENTAILSLIHIFSDVANDGYNTVFVQARPFGDALYDSDLFPWSYTLTGTEGVSPGYDPLQDVYKRQQGH